MAAGPRTTALVRLGPRIRGREPAPTTRICVASDNRITVSAVRRDDVVTLRVVHGDPARTSLASLRIRPPFDPGNINAPTDLLAEALDAAPSDVGATASR